MNNYIAYVPKLYDAQYCLNVLEFGYSIIHLPDWAGGEMARQSKLAGAVKTALLDVDNGFDLTTFPWWDSVNTDFKAEVAPVINIFGQRYALHYIVYYDYNATDAEKAQAVMGALWVLLGALSSTYEKYYPILKAYKDKEAALLAKVGITSSAVSRFNDTPQNTGLYDDDSHTTNITQSSGTTESDNVTPVLRLEEIRRYWRNIQNEWIDEIGRITCEGDNL